MKIIVSPFCKSRDQKFCSVPLEDILPEILENFALAKKGYRDGVILVPIGTKNFKGSIVKLSENDNLTGSFRRRQDGEIPRKEIRVQDLEPLPIIAVDVVLYSNEVLAIGNENSDISADYEVITILTKISEEDQPMPPETLMANHFRWEGNGGTPTNMSPEQFEAALKKSYLFWHDKAILA